MKYYEDMEYFWHYIKDRHEVYKKKELLRLPPPWTENTILNSFKFTNVFRECDRGTKFVNSYIYSHDLPKEDILFNVILYRLFNKIETFLHHGIQTIDSYDHESFSTTLHKLNIEQTVFTNAFVVSGYSMFKDPGMDKIDRICVLLKWITECLDNFKEDILDSNDMRIAYRALVNLPGLGPFLAYQIAVDLSYWNATEYGEDDFVVLGPGAKRGINRLFPEEEVKANGYSGLTEWMRERQFEFWSDYNIDPVALFDDRQYPYLTLMSLENLYCEFSKYMKVICEEGKPRNKYVPDKGYEIFKNRTEEWDKGIIDIFKKEANRKHAERLCRGYEKDSIQR